MKIAVIGASGNAGSRITAELARRGHAVTAIARNPERIAALANVTATKGDLMDQAALTGLLAGHDAAISSVHFLASDPAQADRGGEGFEGRPLPRRRRCGQPRSGPGRPAGDHPRLSRGIQGRSREGGAFLDLLRAEKELNWTFLSPSALFTAGERTGRFRLGTDQLLTASDGKSWISFEDFAVALADEIERPAHIRSRFTVGY